MASGITSQNASRGGMGCMSCRTNHITRITARGKHPSWCAALTPTSRLTRRALYATVCKNEDIPVDLHKAGCIFDAADADSRKARPHVSPELRCQHSSVYSRLVPRRSGKALPQQLLTIVDRLTRQPAWPHMRPYELDWDVWNQSNTKLHRDSSSVRP